MDEYAKHREHLAVVFHKTIKDYQLVAMRANFPLGKSLKVHIGHAYNPQNESAEVMSDVLDKFSLYIGKCMLAVCKPSLTFMPFSDDVCASIDVDLERIIRLVENQDDVDGKTESISDTENGERHG